MLRQAKSIFLLQNTRIIWGGGGGGMLYDKGDLENIPRICTEGTQRDMFTVQLNV